MSSNRSLYCCFNARCRYPYIVCDLHNELGLIYMAEMYAGDELIATICQECPDFDSMGDQVNKEDRGL